MSAILLTIKEAATSKKFIVAVAGLIIATAGKYGLDLDADTVQNVVYVVVAYLIGQGIADANKEAAKVNGTVALTTDNQANLTPPVKDKLL